MKMIWRVRRTIPGGYDTYNGFVIVAESEREARETHPTENFVWDGEKWYNKTPTGSSFDVDRDWPPPDRLEVTLLGIGLEGLETIVLTDFDAG